MSKNCIFCGAEIDDDDLFCGECGKKQDPEEKKRIEQAEAEAKAKAEAEMRLKREQAEREAQQRQAQIDKETEMRIRAEAEAKAKYEHEAQIKREQAEQERLAAEQKKLAKEQVKNSPERKATIGMILGICCIVFAFTGIVPVILFIPGLIYSIKGLKAQKKGQAIAGLILNGWVLAAFVISIIWGIVSPLKGSSKKSDTEQADVITTEAQPSEGTSEILIDNDTVSDVESVSEELSETVTAEPVVIDTRDYTKPINYADIPHESDFEYFEDYVKLQRVYDNVIHYSAGECTADEKKEFARVLYYYVDPISYDAMQYIDDLTLEQYAQGMLNYVKKNPSSVGNFAYFATDEDLEEYVISHSTQENFEDFKNAALDAYRESSSAGMDKLLDIASYSDEVVIPEDVEFVSDEKATDEEVLQLLKEAYDMNPVLYTMMGVSPEDYMPQKQAYKYTAITRYTGKRDIGIACYIKDRWCFIKTSQ